MTVQHKLNWSLGLLALGIFSIAQASGASVSETYTGTLDSESGTPGSVVLESFSLPSPTTVTIFTTSYGGGTNLDGTTTPAGGFQPNITLYNSSGFVVANQSASFSPIANPDPSSGFIADGYLQSVNAAAGTYYVSLTDWQNQMPATAAGLDPSQPAYSQFSGPGGTSFTDVMGDPRTGNFALDISTGAAASAVPEPSTVLLIIPTLAGVVLLTKKARSANNRANSIAN